MIRQTFGQKLQELQDHVLLLGSLVDKAVEHSVAALKARDMDASRQVIADDLEINRMRFALEEHCLDLIATQQPMASDLRAIVAILIIANELERMGDHAEGIAKINIMYGDEPLVKPLIDIPRMAEKSREMLRRSLDAFIRRDAEAAKQIAIEDDEVDALYDQVYRELLLIMIQNPRTITQSTYLLWAAHNLERIADRVTNICERVVFMATGRMEEINVSKY